MTSLDSSCVGIKQLGKGYDGCQQAPAVRAYLAPTLANSLSRIDRDRIDWGLSGERSRAVCLASGATTAQYSAGPLLFWSDNCTSGLLGRFATVHRFSQICRKPDLQKVCQRGVFLQVCCLLDLYGCSQIRGGKLATRLSSTQRYLPGWKDDVRELPAGRRIVCYYVLSISFWPGPGGRLLPRSPTRGCGALMN